MWSRINIDILGITELKWMGMGELNSDELYIHCCGQGASFLLAQKIKNPPAMQETWIQSLGWEDPLEDSMATHSSILAWRMLWTKEPGGLQSLGSQRVRHN